MTIARNTTLDEYIVHQLGFVPTGNDKGNIEEWSKNGIEIWWCNETHWIVDALDQAGIDVEFHTVGELSDFFKGCKLPPLLPD